MFYISAIGHSASLWLSTALTTHPDIVCWHGNRSIPPYDSGINDLSEEEFVKGLLACEQGWKMGVKKFGSCHGFHGSRLLKYVKKYDGLFFAIVRNPINKIHSYNSQYLELPPGAKNSTNYRFDIQQFYKDHGNKINEHFKNVLEKKKKQRSQRKYLIEKLKDIGLYSALKKTHNYFHAQKINKIPEIKDQLKLNKVENISVKKINNKFGIDFIAKHLISDFLNCNEIVVNLDQEIFNEIGAKDFICMEKMTKSSNYFNKAVFKKIMKYNAEKKYLKQVYKVKKSNKHTYKPDSTFEIYNSWPKEYKNYFSQLHEKSSVKKLYRDMDYNLSKIL